MKLFAYIVPLATASFLFAPTANNALLRKMLFDARGNAAAAELFFNKTREFNSSDPLLLGFKAMSELLLCDHTANVIKKYAHFNEGKKLLEEALKKSPLNTELVYFRYTTQTNAPRMLGYYQELSSDKLILIGFLVSGRRQDQQLYEMVKTFLLNSTECTKEEKSLIRKIDEQ